MSKKSQPDTAPQNPSSQSKTPSSSALLSPGFAIKQNHLSSTYENLLMYEQKNIEIEFITKEIQIPKSAIQNQMKQPFVQSTLKGEQIFQKYGSMIQNQPQFLRQLIFHNYLPYLPQKFQNEFSEILLMGTAFEFAWWSSLAIALIQGFRHRRADFSMREKGAKVLGFGFLFIASSIGFHEIFYTPKLKKCFYKNIKSIDSLMDKHIKILKSSGATCQQSTPIQSDKIYISQVQILNQPKTQTQNQEPKQGNKLVQPSKIDKKQTK